MTKFKPLILLSIVIFSVLIALRYEFSSVLVRALIVVLAVVILYITIIVWRRKKEDGTTNYSLMSAENYKKEPKLVVLLKIAMHAWIFYLAITYMPLLVRSYPIRFILNMVIFMGSYFLVWGWKHGTKK